jgi:hypothetical protein
MNQLGWTPTHSFICLSHNIQSDLQTHIVLVGLWPLPFDANRILIAHEQFTSWPILLSYSYFDQLHGRIGTFKWNLPGGSKSDKYKVMEHNIKGSTKPQN